MYIAAMTTPRTAKRASGPLTVQVPMSTGTSGTKPDRPGSAMRREAAHPADRPARPGVTFCMPTYSRMSCVPPRRESQPESRNIAAIDTPWATM